MRGPELTREAGVIALEVAGIAAMLWSAVTQVAPMHSVYFAACFALMYGCCAWMELTYVASRYWLPGGVSMYWAGGRIPLLPARGRSVRNKPLQVQRTWYYVGMSAVAVCITALACFACIAHGGARLYDHLSVAQAVGFSILACQLWLNRASLRAAALPG